jgi:hypothetical protein
MSQLGRGDYFADPFHLRMTPDRRRTHIAIPAWADRRRAAHARDIAALFIEGSAAEAWAAQNSQPMTALVKPAAPDDEGVPVIDIDASQTGPDLDAIVSGFALDGDLAPK